MASRSMWSFACASVLIIVGIVMMQGDPAPLNPPSSSMFAADRDQLLNDPLPLEPERTTAATDSAETPKGTSLLPAAPPTNDPEEESPTRTIRVRDEVTGEDLRRITLLKITDWDRRQAAHPGAILEEEVLARSVESPHSLLVERSPDPDGWVCFAIAEGYGWGRIDVEPAEGDVHQIFLKRCGDLHVHLTGAPRYPEGLELRFSTLDDPRPTITATLPQASPVEFRGMPAGEWVIRAELGRWAEGPIVLGETTVQTPEVGLAQTTIEIAMLPPAPQTHLTGTLMIPKEWGFSSFQLHLDLVDPPRDENPVRKSVLSTSMTPVLGGFEFDAGTVQSGNYELTVPEAALTIAAVVGSQEQEHLLVVVPPPTDLTVRFVDAMTGNAIVGEEAFWTCLITDGYPGRAHQPMNCSVSSGSYHLRVPLCDVSVSLEGDRYRHSEFLRLGSGQTSFTIQVEPPCGLALTLEEGEVRRRWPVETTPDLIDLVSGESNRSTSWKDDHIVVSPSSPGRYRVIVGKPIEGFQPVPDFEVLIPRGKIVRRTIRLTPRE